MSEATDANAVDWWQRCQDCGSREARVCGRWPAMLCSACDKARQSGETVKGRERRQRPKKVLIDDTESMMQTEVAALIRRGVPQDEAESIVGIQGSDAGRGFGAKMWLPTPTEIADQTAAIRKQWQTSEYKSRRRRDDGRR